jgi:putative heme-binding domain-containing protein
MPAQYRNAFWMMDWSYGRIVAVHMQPKGASYTATFDTVLHGKPLNVTDMVVGPDGAVYFATGGRGTQSGLYRVSFTGPAPIDSDFETVDRSARAARSLRHELEKFHGRQDPKAVATLWPHLGSDDRFTRYAARIALESQPVEEWKQKALDEKNPTGALTALLALSRMGGTSSQADVLNALSKFPMASLPEELQLLKLRVIEVNIARNGRPADEFVKRGIEKLSPLYPAKSWPLNRELSQILIYFDAPGIVSKTLDLVAKAETQEEQLHYIVALRKANTWTLDERKRWFSWFQNRSAGQDAGATYPSGGNYFINASAKHPAYFEQWFADVSLKAGNGASYNNFIKKMRAEILSELSDSDRVAIAPFLATSAATLKPQREHKFVQEWKLADFANDVNGPSRGRNFANGREAFLAGQCIQCHQLNGEGGAVGPDLTGAGAKYSRRDLLESILEPSKVISDQYQNMTVTKKNDEDVTGRIVEETDARLVIVTNPLTNERVEVKKSDVKSRTPSKLSPMPEGLASILTKEEILDLVAYLESAGNQRHAAFRR